MFNLTFLNSGILFLTSAIIIPLLIYLFARKKPERIVFSSIKFIKESQKKQKKKINIKNILLLIIRMLIILLTILAISRPSLRAPFLSKGKKHPQAAIAMIIDNSYSMDYLVDTQTDLEKAKEIVSSINSLFSENDITTLLSLDKSWNEVNSRLHYGRVPSETIDNIGITAVKEDLKDVFELALSRLSESHLVNQEIYFITDRQNYELPAEYPVPTFIIRTSADTLKSNLSCQDVKVSKKLVGRELKQNIIFELVNHSPNPSEDVIHELYLDGYTVAEQVTSLEGYQSRRLEFEVSLENSGWHSGYVEVRNERLTFDNRNYFSFYYELSPRVAMLTTHEEIPVTLQTILEVYTANPDNIDLISDPNRLSLESLQDYDNVIITSDLEISGRVRYILEELEKAGKGVLYLTGSSLNPTTALYLEEFFGIEFGNNYEESEGINLTYVNEYHPITDLISIDRSIAFTDLRLSGADSGILLQAGNYPVAIEKNNSIIWLFDPGSLRNPFFLDAAFPVFAYNCLQYISNRGSMGGSAITGKVLRGSGQILTLPSGDEIELINRNFTLKEPGIYDLSGELLAVNLDYEESDFRVMEPQRTANLYYTGENWKDEILRSRYGIEIWKYLLILVLILFILEMILIKKEESKGVF